MNKPAARPTLAENLAAAEAVKAEMTQRLRELEQAATGRAVAKPGAWRHHPKTWDPT